MNSAFAYGPLRPRCGSEFYDSLLWPTGLTCRAHAETFL